MEYVYKLKVIFASNKT